MKKLNIGDNVRFLNEVGGGTIVKIDEQTKMVYVQDADTRMCCDKQCQGK